MNPIKLRITVDGAVHGLWSDAVDWQGLGPVSVHRASHVEFCETCQMWFVRASWPSGRIRRLLQRLLCRPFGEVLHRARTRRAALDWERAYFEPGGAGWKPDA